MILNLFADMDLHRIFNPQNVALIGATERRGSVGFGIFNNLLEARDIRQIFPVNPNQTQVMGIKSFASILDIGSDVDLAVIAVPAHLVLKMVEECCEKKVGGIIVISAGFSEIGKKGLVLQEKIAQKARRAEIPLVGPNCLGIINTANRLNASFAPGTPPQGDIAFVSQSGALLDVLVDRARDEGYGISSAISYGNEASVFLDDFLDYLGQDDKTKVIALYLEGLNNAREFIAAARKISSKKPIVVMKGGRHEIESQAIRSHTGSLAGNYRIYQAAFKQAGITEAHSLEEMMDIAKGFSWQPRWKNGAVIVTNGGGCGVMAVDYCLDEGIILSKLSRKTVQRISKSPFMHAAWSQSNPVDILGDASSERYEAAINAVLAQNNVNGLILIQTPQIMTDPLENAKIAINAKKKYPQKTIFSFFLGGSISKEAINLLEREKIPNYSDLKRGIVALAALLKR